MKRPLFLLLLAAFGGAHAQQTASARFDPAPVQATTAASAQFTRPEIGTESCAHIDPTLCKPTRTKRKPVRRAQSTPKPDPLAVHPDAAIKDTKAPEIVLPGVIKIAGADAHALDFSRARIVEVTNGGSHTVYLSVVDQNRIQLPWTNTKVVGTHELDIDKSPTSNNVYVQFKEAVERPVQVYFEQPNGSSVLGLQLVPKKIPAQTILVRDASVLVAGTKPVKGGDHVAAIQALMEQVALGGAPQGYSQSDLRIGPIVMNGLVVTPQKRYSSADRDIYLYEVANPGPNKAALRESEFDAENVLAVSIFPKPVLARNERTAVIVMTRKATGG